MSSLQANQKKLLLSLHLLKYPKPPSLSNMLRTRNCCCCLTTTTTTTTTTIAATTITTAVAGADDDHDTAADTATPT